MVVDILFADAGLLGNLPGGQLIFLQEGDDGMADGFMLLHRNKGWLAFGFLLILYHLLSLEYPPSRFGKFHQAIQGALVKTLDRHLVDEDQTIFALQAQPVPRRQAGDALVMLAADAEEEGIAATVHAARHQHQRIERLPGFVVEAGGGSDVATFDRLSAGQKGIYGDLLGFQRTQGRQPPRLVWLAGTVAKM